MKLGVTHFSVLDEIHYYPPLWVLSCWTLKSQGPHLCATLQLGCVNLCENKIAKK